MKTKIKTFRSLLVALAIMAIGATAFASYGSSGNQNDCPNPNGSGTISCVTFHDNGYTGSHGGGGNFPNGTTFATFNGYRDQASHDGRPFDERQFVYIESEQAQYPGRPYPSPWEDASDYNFQQGITHTINFNGTETQKIGVWGYMHNNGVQNEYPAFGTTIRFNGWSENTAQLTHSPKMTISGSNTRPSNVWANVTITGSQAFTLIPTEAYLVREDMDGRPGVSPVALRPDQVQTLTSSGIKVNSNPNTSTHSGGTFDSSHVHYAKVYLEFEATPEESGVCHSLNITDPSEQSLTVDENGFVDRNLAFTVDTDPNVVSGYRVLSTRDTITFDNSGQSDIEINNTSTVMDGGPAPNEPLDTVQVWALDQNGNGIQECWDDFVVLPEEEQDNTCDIFNTIPTPPGTDADPVPLNEFVTIDIDELLDTDGAPYTDNGATPTIRYCYGQPGIQFLPDSGNVVIDSNGCAVALATDTMNVIAEQVGQMTMYVVGAERDCHDSFRTKGETIEDEICLDLDINQSEFTGDNDTYRVTVETDPDGLNYDVEWFVDSTNGDGMSPVTEGDDEINLDDYNYNFTPGDTLVARATNINDPENNCMDQLRNIPTECERLVLEPDEFQIGQNNEICIDVLDGWTLNEGDDLEYSVDGGSTQTVELYDEAGDLCFLLMEDDTEDAEIIDVWVPEWENVCFDELTPIIEPPEFSKNAKSNDATAFTHRTVANFSDDYVNYELTYLHNANEEIDVVITDTIGIGKRYIQGYIAAVGDDLNNAPEGGRIYYDDGSMDVYVDGDQVEECDEDSESDDLCYEGNIGDASGVEVKNVPDREEVRVEYRGKIVESTVNPENCSDPDHALNETGVCGEIYPNTAEFEDNKFSGEDDAEVIIPCPFIIIRAGGDVFLENPFDYGVDTLSCSEIRTSDTPVITGTPPDDRDLTASGASILKQFDERLCNSDSEGSTDIAGISSLICELELTSEELTQQAIVQSLSRNVTLFSRYAKNLDGVSEVRGDTIDQISSTNDVYVKADGDLKLGGKFADKARTIVVLNNDVYVNNNITFEDPQSLEDPRKVPSLAVIVIGGNIIIDPSVKETHAIFFVQEGEDGGGQICEGPDCGEAKYNTDTRLTHYGSIYGDIEDLLKYRVRTGDPTKEEGAILIRFDNRVYLNTPPLLNKLIDVTQGAF